MLVKLVKCTQCRCPLFSNPIRGKWCSSCYGKGMRNRSIRKLRSRASVYRQSEWIAHFKVLYHHRPDIDTKAKFAESMGMKRKTFDRTLNRVRAAGLLSKEYVFPKL